MDNSNRTIFIEAVHKFFGQNPCNPYNALLALYFRKNHLISKDLSKDEIDKNHFTLTKGITDNERLLNIIKIFERVANDLNSRKNALNLSSKGKENPNLLLDLYTSLLKIDDKWLDENFNALFDAIIRRCFYSERHEIYSQPKELTGIAKFIISKDIKKVYDPFAGLGSYSLAVPEGAKYIGEEIYPLVAAIGNLRLLANDTDGFILQETSINDNDFDADFIVSTPPSDIKINLHDEPWGKDYPNSIDPATFIIQKCINKKKRGFLVIPSEISTAKSYNVLRKKLIETDSLEMVIGLPMINISSIGKPIIFIINPFKELKDTVKFIDARNCFLRNNQNGKRRYDVKKILDLIKEESPSSFLISSEQIKNTGHIMDPSLYVRKEIECPEGASLINLSDLAVLRSPTPQKGVGEAGKYISFNLCNPQNVIKIFTPDDINEEWLPQKVRSFEGKCLLVSPPGKGNLNVMCVDSENEVLYCNRGALIVKPDESKVLLRYLAIQFSLPYIAQQMKGASTVIPYEAVKGTQVIVPSLEEQAKVIEEYQAATLSELGFELLEEKKKKEEELRKELRRRRHTLLNEMGDICDTADVLDDFIDSAESPVDKNTNLFDDPELNVGALTRHLRKSLRRVTELIDALTNMDNFGEPERINIPFFCREYAEGARAMGNPVVWVDERGVFDKDRPQSALNINFSKADLITVFNNIVNNAMKYGMPDPAESDSPEMENRKDFIVRMESELTSDDNNMGENLCVISIKNNGLPLADQLEPDQIFEWGKTTGKGTGTGGSHIKNLVEHFGGKIEAFRLAPEDNDGFTVEYRLSLPLAYTDE